MLIIALVLALIGLAALVFAVVTSNELVAWVCIGASVLGVLLLIVDAVRERQQGARSKYDDSDEDSDEDATEGSDTAEPEEAVDYPDEGGQVEAAQESAAEAPEESAAAKESAVSGDRSGLSDEESSK